MAHARISVADNLETEWLGPVVNSDPRVHGWRRVQKAQGYRWIMVNGGVTFEDGKCTGAVPGKLLRR